MGLKAFAEGASHSMTLWRWIPLGINQSVGQIPGGVGDWYVDVTLRIDSLSALMLLFVTFVGFPHPRLLLGLHGRTRRATGASSRT